MCEAEVQAIQDSVHTEKIVVNDETFLTRPVYRIPREPKEDRKVALKVATLTAIVSFVNEKVDNAELDKMIVHVASPTEVVLMTQETDGAIEGVRHEFMSVKARTPSSREFNYGNFYPLEDFIIAVSTKMADTTDRADLLKLLGNMSSDESIKQQDDGVTQQVTVKSGIDMVRTDITNPVELIPIRTFHEIEQPASPFWLRVKKTPQGVHAAIFETDGGMWELEAIKSIVDYLQENISSDDVTIPVLG